MGTDFAGGCQGSPRTTTSNNEKSRSTPYSCARMEAEGRDPQSRVRISGAQFKTARPAKPDA